MNCPVCDAKLRTVEKNAVEVDICPDCKGIWLDRGELEKIVEMAAGSAPARDEQRVGSEDRVSEDRHEKPHDEEHPEHGSKGEKPRRKGSWLTGIVESFGGGDD